MAQSTHSRPPAGFQLTWLDASTPPTINFAPNVTPGTFNDPPAPVEFVPESTLFPSSSSPATPSSKKSGHSKKKAGDYIPRPANAFILFRSAFIKNQHVSSEVETNHSTLSKIAGITWAILPPHERDIWYAKAKVLADEHKKQWPGYTFKPIYPKEKPEKRKVKEVGQRDQKRCEKIAALLVEGKKGAELDAAIKEFDRHHVPEVVTRFEEPITARAFRRSSSEPAPGTEHTNPPFFVSAPKASKRKSKKVRSSSSQPEPASSPSSSAPTSPEYSPLTQFEGSSESLSEYSPMMPHRFPSADPAEIESAFVSSRSSSSRISAEVSPQDFSTFTFNACAAPPIQFCDPLTPTCEQTPHVFAPVPTAPYFPQAGAYQPSGLTINTNFLQFEPWAGTAMSSPSPLSSSPSTPLLGYEDLPSRSTAFTEQPRFVPQHRYPDHRYPEYYLPVDQGGMLQFGNSYAQTYESAQPNGQADYPVFDPSFHGAPLVGPSAKREVSFDDRSRLNQFLEDISKSFAASSGVM